MHALGTSMEEGIANMETNVLNPMTGLKGLEALGKAVSSEKLNVRPRGSRRLNLL